MEESIQNLDMKNLIEQNNIALRSAIQALEMLSNQVANQVQVEPAPPIDERYYPGYTTPAKFAFMQK